MDARQVGEAVARTVVTLLLWTTASIWALGAWKLVTLFMAGYGLHALGWFLGLIIGSSLYGFSKGRN
jgi:hypothetical protein